MDNRLSAATVDPGLAKYHQSAEQRQRRLRLLGDVDLNTAALLELGALDRPLAVGPHVRHADHLDTAGLCEKYSHDPAVTKDAIVAVDYVLDGRRLIDIVADQRFDGVVASHVIEHVPDIIGWFTELAEILRPCGKIYLYIPDGRYCFDHRRPVTTPGQLLDAHLAKRKAPSPGAVLDALGLHQHEDVRRLWRGAVDSPAAAHLAPDQLWQMVRAVEGGSYVDVHCHVFTPAAFFRCLRYLIEGDLFGFQVADFVDTRVDELEFQVTLQLSDLPPGPERRAALLASLPDLTVPPMASVEMRGLLFNTLDRIRQACDVAEQQVGGALAKTDQVAEASARTQTNVTELHVALVAREVAITAELQRMRSHPAVRLMDAASRFKHRLLSRISRPPA